MLVRRKQHLEEIVQKLSMKLYEQAAAEAEAAEGTEGAEDAKAEDDVVDADFEEVVEDDKK